MGVDHVGIGVGDVDAAIEFYGRHVGFDRVLFDYTGRASRARGGLGHDAYARASPCWRTAVRRRSGRAGSSSCRCSTATGPRPFPTGQAWGEVGVCEICLHVRNVQAVHDALVAAGCASLMEPMSADVPPSGVASTSPTSPIPGARSSR